jgi:hypothetical protein
VIVALLKRRAAKARQQRSALTGATALVTMDSSWRTWKFGNRDWQIEGWRLYDIVGEERFLANWVGDAVSQARLYVTEVDERGEEQGEVTDQAISRLAAVPLGTGAQRDDNLRLAGVDLAVGGECWIVGEGAALNPEASEGAWFVVTGASLKSQGGIVKVKRPHTQGDGGWFELTQGVDILARCWRPHPNDTDQADSPTRSAIPPLREIELLTKRQFAELDSRLTGAGVWFMPEGIDFPRGPDDPPGIAGFMAYVQRAAAASIKDQSSASAMVPIMATVPDGTDLTALKDGLINFWSPMSAEIPEQKKDAIVRLASSYEIPNEVLLGLSTANHWTAWAISEDGIKRIKPYLATIADTLTRWFLRPALTKMGVANPERYAFAFDTAPLAVRPNRLEDATTLHDRMLIKDVEMVKAAAFSEEQMPTPAERAIMILLRAIDKDPSLLTQTAVQQLLGLPVIEAPEPTIVRVPGEVGDPEAEEDEDGAPNGGAAPEVPSSNRRAITASADDALRARLDARISLASLAPPSPERVFNASAKLMIYRALELAGGRLTTPQERRGRWADVPRHELHARVGPITPDKADKITEGAWNHVGAAAADLGVDPEQLHRLLAGYVHELLIRGIPHHDDLLYAALTAARRPALGAAA